MSYSASDDADAAHFVKLSPGSKTSTNLSIKQLDPNAVYKVLPTSPQRYYHLESLKTKRRIVANGIDCDRLRPSRRLFVKVVEAELPTAEQLELYGEEAAKTDFKLRNANAMPSVDQIWRATVHVDLYTNKHKDWYAEHGTSPARGAKVERDHIFEIQLANSALVGAMDNIPLCDMDQSDAVSAMRDYLNSVDNMNNTDWQLNRYWKGVAVNLWKKEYIKANGNTRTMASCLDGDSSLSGVLRTTLCRKNNWMDSSYVCCPATHCVVRVEKTKKFTVLEPSAVACKEDLAAVQPPVYAPNWARRVTTQMSRCGWKLGDEIDNNDISDSLRQVMHAADL